MTYLQLAEIIQAMSEQEKKQEVKVSLGYRARTLAIPDLAGTYGVRHNGNGEKVITLND